MDGKTIGAIINEAHEAVYGKGHTKGSVFEGGNPGRIAIAMAIMDQGVRIEHGLLAIADAIQERNKSDDTDIVLAMKAMTEAIRSTNSQIIDE